MDHRHFPDRLKQFRRERGYSLRRLASIAGTTFGHLYRLEHSQRVPGLDLAVRLADALDYPLSAFLQPAAGEKKSR